MKTKLLALLAVISTAATFSVRSADSAADQAGPPAPAQPTATAPTTATAENAARKPRQVSPGIAEIIKLVEAGVEPVVIEAYIQNSRTRFQPTADDILHLHRLGVSSQILTALLRHEGTGETKTAPVDRPPAEKSPAAEQTGGTKAQPPIYTYVYPPYSIPWVTYPRIIYPNYSWHGYRHRPYSYRYQYGYCPPFFF